MDEDGFSGVSQLQVASSVMPSRKSTAKKLEATASKKPPSVAKASRPNAVKSRQAVAHGVMGGRMNKQKNHSKQDLCNRVLGEILDPDIKMPKAVEANIKKTS